MSYDLGIDEFLKIGNAFAIVESGAMIETSAVNAYRSIGDWKPADLREGQNVCYGNANIIVQEKTILEYVERDANGALTGYDIIGGGDSGIRKHTGCKFDTLVLSCNGGEELRASLTWKAKSDASDTTLVHSIPNKPVEMWFNGAIAGFGAIECVGFTITINNNTDWIFPIDNTITPPRTPKYVSEGQQVVTCNLRLLAPDGVDITAEQIALIGSTTFTFSGSGVDTITITLTNLKHAGRNRPFNPNTLIEYGINYIVENWSVS